MPEFVNLFKLPITQPVDEPAPNMLPEDPIVTVLVPVSRGTEE